jgi:hypothetical protein
MDRAFQEMKRCGVTPQVKSYRGALGDYIESVAAGGERNPVIEESYADDAGLVDRLASLLGPDFKKKWDNGAADHDQIVSLLFKLEPGHPTELIDRLVSLLGSETRNKWDNGALTHDQIVSLFKDALDADFGWEDAAKELGQRLGWRWDFAGTLEKRALFEEMCDKVAAKIARQLGEDDLEKAFWDFDTSRKRGSERDAFKMVVRAALSQRELFNSESKPANGDSIVGRDGKLTTDPNNDRYDRIYEAQLGMYNGIRDLTDAVRALPISSVIAAKDEAIAAKDAELETLREYVRHLQRQVGAS